LRVIGWRNFRPITPYRARRQYNTLQSNRQVIALWQSNCHIRGTYRSHQRRLAVMLSRFDQVASAADACLLAPSLDLVWHPFLTAYRHYSDPKSLASRSQPPSQRHPMFALVTSIDVVRNPLSRLCQSLYCSATAERCNSVSIGDSSKAISNSCS